jgi:hypothetical protein
LQQEFTMTVHGPFADHDEEAASVRQAQGPLV